MTSRSAILSPPAVAGLALFALVLGAIFGLRLTGDDPTPDTEVAGTVVERSEPAEAADPTETAADEDPIVVPQPDEEQPAEDGEPAAEPAPAPAPEQPAPAPQPEPEPTVGLIRDEPAGDGGAPADNDDDGGNGRNNNPDPDPEPEPTEPAETEDPEPEPTEDDRGLHEGEGHSRDTAIADNGEWLFQEVTGHGDGGGDSLEPQARLTVGFDAAAKQGDGPVRALQCQAWLTAGDGRVTTDEDHVFEVALLALDDNGVVAGVVTSVLERHAYDLAAGESTADQPMATTPIEVDAEDGVDYTCGVTYRSR